MTLDLHHRSRTKGGGGLVVRHRRPTAASAVRQAWRSLGGLVLFLILLPAAGRAAQVASYEAGSPEHPLIRYPDGELSLNDRCPVRRNKLNLRMPPVYVNGRPIGFC